MGTVYLGAACGETVYVKKLFVSRPDRALVRARAAQAALELALRLAQAKFLQIHRHWQKAPGTMLRL